MLSKERQLQITKIVMERGAATVPELADLFGSSPSTIRRDLVILDKAGKVNKVFGGATSILNKPPHSVEDAMEVKHNRNVEAKRAIAQKAASLISPKDLVYIDAGSTTEALVDYIEDRSATYITNSIPLSCKLAERGFVVRLLGGLVKSSTQAVIGSDTRVALKRFNFNIGFFGTNGITVKEGYTTPDMEEGEGKHIAMEHCQRSIILSDSSKFGQVAGITFANLKDAAIITNISKTKNIKQLKDHTDIQEV